MISQSELAERFATAEPAESIPDASNVSVQSADGDTPYDAYIVGYGWAVYAARPLRIPNAITLFTGWHGYSPSTSCQLAELRKGFQETNAEVEEEDTKPATVTHGWRARQAGAESIN